MIQNTFLFESNFTFQHINIQINKKKTFFNFSICLTNLIIPIKKIQFHQNEFVATVTKKKLLTNTHIFCNKESIVGIELKTFTFCSNCMHYCVCSLLHSVTNLTF